MATSLLLLLDDIASVLDDVSVRVTAVGVTALGHEPRLVREGDAPADHAVGDVPDGRHDRRPRAGSRSGQQPLLPRDAPAPR